MAARAQVTTSGSTPTTSDGLLQLYRGALGSAELLFCRGGRTRAGPQWRVPSHNFVVPLAGTFVWHTSGGEVVGDVNQVLMASEGQSAAFSHPLGAETSFVFTPSLDLLEKVTRLPEHRIGGHPAFAARVRLAHAGIQLTVSRISAACPTAQPLEIEELLTSATRHILDSADLSSPRTYGQSARTVHRAKDYLHANFKANPSLQDIATAAGVSALYLTDLFRRGQGKPLYAHQLHMRLAVALNLLPSCEDITDLALDLCFSSHSHFTLRFRDRYGLTPSAFRSERHNRPAGGEQSSTRTDMTSWHVKPLCEARGGDRGVNGVNVLSSNVIKGIGHLRRGARRDEGPRAQWALEELGLPYRVHALDHTGGELDGEAYSRIRAFHQAPAIDDDGFVLSESTAIVLYLAEKAGKLIPGGRTGSHPRHPMVLRSGRHRLP